MTSHPLWATLESLTARPRADGLASLIAATSSFSGSGTSFVTRDLALLAASFYGQNGGRVALIDYDINQQTQFAAFDTPRSIGMYGAAQGPFDATFGEKPFWQVSPEMMSSDGQRHQASSHCGLYLIGETALAVSKFDWTSVRSGQSVHLVRSQDYWLAARKQFSLIFVDCPAFERSDMAMNVIADADKTILVSAEQRALDPAHEGLARQIRQNGGECAGLILNAGARAGSHSSYTS